LFACLLACLRAPKKERKRGLAFIHNHISEKNVKEKEPVTKWLVLYRFSSFWHIIIFLQQIERNNQSWC
jgi:hypothetical protein